MIIHVFKCGKNHNPSKFVCLWSMNDVCENVFKRNVAHNLGHQCKIQRTDARLQEQHFQRMNKTKKSSKHDEQELLLCYDIREMANWSPFFVNHEHATMNIPTASLRHPLATAEQMFVQMSQSKVFLSLIAFINNKTKTIHISALIRNQTKLMPNMK